VRGEPDVRDDDVIEPLRAQIRDPLWMLTRQWQLGEMRGADSGSPAWVELTERTGQLTSWQANGHPPEAIRAAPLEPQTGHEPFTPDLATRIELGQTFETLLREQSVADLIALFRAAAAYSIVEAPNDPSDAAEARLRRICAGRAIDGVALYRACRAAAPALPPQPVVVAERQPQALAAVAAFLAWVDATFGELAIADPTSWQPSRLEYQLDFAALSPSGAAVVLAAFPGADGMLDWSAFDLRQGTTGGSDVAVARTRTIVPTHVRFRGAPNARFWDFELSGTDLGSIVPDRRDLARLAITEFVLLHANDWFVVPVDLHPGALYQADQLLVHDVFGTLTLIERADREAVSAGHWSLFATSIAGSSATSDFFLFPASAATAMQTSSPIEEVQFARDEMANMVWALERLTENQIGEAWSGHERDIARNSATKPPNPPQSAPIPLRYLIESRVPEYWISFLPVSVDTTRGAVALERSAMLRADGSTVEPIGRILRPTSLAQGVPFRIPEEEIPRTGLRVQRVTCRSRWIDGTTHLWQMRRIAPGSGEVNSALRFDVAVQNV
jgi:hypothetical protein